MTIFQIKVINLSWSFRWKEVCSLCWNAGKQLLVFHMRKRRKVAQKNKCGCVSWLSFIVYHYSWKQCRVSVFVFIFITRYTVSFSCWSTVYTLASKHLFSWHDLSKYSFHLTHDLRREVSFYIGIQVPYVMNWFELVPFPLN